MKYKTTLEILAAAESEVMEKKSNLSPRRILYTTGYTMKSQT
jgi:hypothetical protein